MFTGIIEAVGTISKREGGRLEISFPALAWVDAFQLGESIGINGCCLTVVQERDNILSFDVSEETYLRTSLGQLALGSKVNLERAMRADGRFGGHVVQGHVDATGQILSIEPEGNSSRIRIRFPSEYGRYIIDKGSITVDGISLTAVTPTIDSFEVWIIPHTIENTHLHSKSVGDLVNLEFDMIAKYVEKLLAPASR